MIATKTSKPKPQGAQSSSSVHFQKASRHYSGSGGDADHYRLSRFGSLPSIVSPKLVDEDLDDPPMMTASVEDDEVISRPHTIALLEPRAASKHRKSEEVEKKAVQTTDSATITMKRPTKFTSSVQLDLVSPNRVTIEPIRTVIPSESTTSPSAGNRHALPRISAEVPHKQVRMRTLIIPIEGLPTVLSFQVFSLPHVLSSSPLHSF